jgi:hypothetical protein
LQKSGQMGSGWHRFFSRKVDRLIGRIPSLSHSTAPALSKIKDSSKIMTLVSALTDSLLTWYLRLLLFQVILYLRIPIALCSFSLDFANMPPKIK